MKTNSMKLSVVRSRDETGQNNSADIAGLLYRWDEAEKLLNTLYKQENECLLEQESDAPLPTDLVVQLEAVERVQFNLLSKLVSAPAHNLHDVISKLEIWKNMVMPDGNNEASAQPTDLLVQSVLSDLLNVVTQN